MSVGEPIKASKSTATLNACASRGGFSLFFSLLTACPRRLLQEGKKRLPASNEMQSKLERKAWLSQTFIHANAVNENCSAGPACCIFSAEKLIHDFFENLD